MLEKTIEVDKIEVCKHGQIQVRKATIISEDGAEISKTFHRYVLLPGDDISEEDINVSNIASMVWTDDVLSNWADLQAQ